MKVRNLNKTVDVESQAKNTLAYFSEFDQNYNQWDSGHRTACSKNRKYRLLDPIKNVKLSRQDRSRSTNTQSFFKTRTALIPCKVSLENQPQRSKRVLKAQPRNPYLATAKENYRPHKTIRNAYSLTRQAQQRQEQQGFDFMQYWIRHRFQDGAINVLVEKLKQKSQTSMLRM